jgi:M6 family metalloprotease-like protein
MKAMFQTAQFRKVITIFFLIAGVLFSTLNPGGPTAAHALQGGTESLSGWLTILRGDSQDGSTKEIHMLATDDGQSVPLLLDDNVTAPVGGLLALDRQHITVNGDWSGALSAQGGSGQAAFRVASIAPLPQADAASAAVTGSQKWISIMCKFQGLATEPKNLSYFQNMYMAAYPGLDHYWREQSYNLINTVGSTASGWFVLPHAKSFYMSGGRFNLDQAALDCTGVANASVNFSTFAGINLMFNDELDGFAWGGGSYLTLDGVTKVWDMTWEPPWGYSNVAVLGHEMGHAFGLPHSSGNYGETYDNEWDVMSDTWIGCYNRGHSDPVFGCLGQHTISYHKDKLGWIPASQKTSVGAGGSITVLLEQLALPQTTNLKLVRIPIGGSSTHFYTVEARRLTGYDVGLPGQAVIIHDVDTNRSGSPAHVIDIDNNTVTGDAGAMWTTGEVFRNNTYKIAVAVLASTASGFRVRITSGLNGYYIGGNIGLSNVTVNYTGGSTTTDATGRYIFPVSAGWDGTVIPSKPGYTFSPANRSYSNVAADMLAQNFTASSFYSISGNTGVAGTTLSYTSGTLKKVVSQANGTYSLTVPGGWTGIVTPSHPCFTFNPVNRPYTSLAGNQIDQNYTPTFNSGSGCADVSVYVGTPLRGRFGLPSGASTRASFAGVSGGSVEVVSNNAVPLLAAERVIYKVSGVNTSFSEMMGLPYSQLDSTYWLPWYNNVDLDTQLRLGNVQNATATVHVSIGGQEMPGSPFTIGPYGSARKSYAGIDEGPVKIESDIPIVASERVIYNVNGVDTSFTEMMALPNNQLDTTYWLPWYNNKDLNSQLRFANVSGSPAEVHVTIGGVEMTGSPFTLPAGASARKSYAGIDKGPVEIVSDQNIVVSERVIYNVNGVNTSFSELMALPDNQLTTTYWLPWYNNVALNSQLRFANVSGSPAQVHVYIGGQEMTGSPFPLLAGASARKSFAGIDKGPIEIVSDQNIVVSERVIYNVGGVNTSFSELMGLASNVLHFSNWLPYYNNVDLDTQLRFAAP